MTAFDEIVADAKVADAKARLMRGRRFTLTFDWAACLILQDVIDDAIHEGQSPFVVRVLRAQQRTLHAFTGEDLPPDRRRKLRLVRTGGAQDVFKKGGA